MTRLTEADVGKTVVTEDGGEIGTIAAVENNVASVDPDPSLAEELKAKLGWRSGASEEGTYRLQADAVSTVSTETVVVLG